MTETERHPNEDSELELDPNSPERHDAGEFVPDGMVDETNVDEDDSVSADEVLRRLTEQETLREAS